MVNKVVRFVFCVTLALVCTAPVVAANKVAPADEYFGRQKISTLGIDNMIRDTDVRESFNPALASRLYGSLLAAEDALQDWAVKYPHDSWIPKRAYMLSHLFWRMHTPEATAAAERCRSLLFRSFPTHRFAQMARGETEASMDTGQGHTETAISASPQPANAAK